MNTMREDIIKQEVSDDELMRYANKIIDVLKPLNEIEKHKVLDSLLDSLNDVLKEKEIVVIKK